MYTQTFLKPFLDRSNFKVLRNTSDFQGGAHGKLKLETSDNIPLEGVFLSSKVYSLSIKSRAPVDSAIGQGEFGYKRAAKGCAKSKVDTDLPHAMYKAVYEEVTYGPTVTSNHIHYSAVHSTMVTLMTTVNPLSLFCDKRCWLSKDKSVGWGHALSYSDGYRPGDIICIRGGGGGELLT